MEKELKKKTEEVVDLFKDLNTYKNRIKDIETGVVKIHIHNGNRMIESDDILNEAPVHFDSIEEYVISALKKAYQDLIADAEQKLENCFK